MYDIAVSIVKYKDVLQFGYCFGTQVLQGLEVYIIEVGRYQCYLHGLG